MTRRPVPSGNVHSRCFVPFQTRDNRYQATKKNPKPHQMHSLYPLNFETAAQPKDVEAAHAVSPSLTLSHQVLWGRTVEKGREAHE